MLAPLLLSFLAPAAALEHFLPHDTFGSAKAYSDLISLNSRVPSQVGAIWAQKANDLREWSLEVKYRVNGPEHGGKGLAIWYAADRGQGGPVYGSIDNWDGLGLFLTAEPDGSGSLRGHLNDRSTQFAKLDSPGRTIFSLDRSFAKSDAEKSAFGSCSFDYRNLGTINSIKISYNEQSLKVMHDDQLCFENHDLSLPTGFYVGVSSAASELADSHELFAVELTSQSHIPASRSRQQPPVAAGRPGFTITEKDQPAALDSAMQRIITKLIADSDKTSSQMKEITQMKGTIERIESAISVLKSQPGDTSKSENAGNARLMHEGLKRQIQRMEEKFVQMERHIEKQTDHIVASLPPVEKPLRTAVYVLIFVQLLICGAYIMYRRRTEEKSKFL